MKKYLADLEKYKKDSVEWVKADKAYPDSLQAHRFTKSLEKDIQAMKKVSTDFENTPETKHLNDLYRRRDILEKDDSRVAELEKVVDEIHKIWDGPDQIEALKKRNQKIDEISVNLDKYSYYGVPNGMLEKEGEVERVDYQTTYKDIRDYSGKSAPREKLPIKLDPEEFKFFYGNHDGWNFYPYFKKPNTPVKPERPLKNFTEKITYNPKYEDLNMRSLWATMVKKNPNEKIGTLHTLDPNFEKGFTLEEAMSFPQEIKDKYNIDYIYNQIKRKQ